MVEVNIPDTHDLWGERCALSLCSVIISEASPLHDGCLNSEFQPRGTWKVRDAVPAAHLWVTHLCPKPRHMATPRCEEGTD